MLTNWGLFLFQPPTTFAELMGGGEKRVWPVWELFKWFLGLSSHTMAAIGTCFCFCVGKRRIEISRLFLGSHFCCLLPVSVAQVWPWWRCFRAHSHLSSFFSRKRVCKRSWMSFWVLMEYCSILHTLSWPLNTISLYSPPSTSLTQVSLYTSLCFSNVWVTFYLILHHKFKAFQSTLGLFSKRLGYSLRDEYSSIFWVRPKTEPNRNV